MAGSAVSCRPHPRQEPSALARTLGSVRRGAGQPALLPRRALGNQRSYRDGVGKGNPIDVRFGKGSRSEIRVR